MWARIYIVANVTAGPLQGATMAVWKENNNYKLVITNDPSYNGDYAKDAIINESGGPFALVRFNAISGTTFYYKTGTEDGLIYVSSNGIAVVEE